MLTRERLCEVLSWDEAKRTFTWVAGYKKGTVAGSISSGIYRIYVDGRAYRASDLITLMETGILRTRRPNKNWGKYPFK